MSFSLPEQATTTRLATMDDGTSARSDRFMGFLLGKGCPKLMPFTDLRW
jgi:hypothetical protein